LIDEVRIMAEEYILGNSISEIKRLEIQASLFESLTKQTLLNAGLKKGMSCIDIGCGSGSVSRLMARMVGKTGRIVGVDIDDKYLQYCSRRNIALKQNIEFIHHDICKSQLDSNEEFDIVYARFVFQHLRDKRQAIRSMKRLVKKGGAVIIQDLDHAPGSWLCYPENEVFNTLRKVYVALIKNAGGDPLAGRKLYKLLIDESLNANVECYSPCILMGQEPYSSLGWQLAESLRVQILKHGLQSEQEYAKMYEGLKKLAKDRGSFVAYSRLFSVLGRNRE
jgi:ubiquinone/menaquinone biosynthesis C-methylase UbiE